MPICRGPRIATTENERSRRKISRTCSFQGITVHDTTMKSRRSPPRFHGCAVEAPASTGDPEVRRSNRTRRTGGRSADHGPAHGPAGGRRAAGGGPAARSEVDDDAAVVVEGGAPHPAASTLSIVFHLEVQMALFGLVPTIVTRRPPTLAHLGWFVVMASVGTIVIAATNWMAPHEARRGGQPSPRAGTLALRPSPSPSPPARDARTPARALERTNGWRGDGPGGPRRRSRP